MCTSNRADDPTQYDLPAPGPRVPCGWCDTPVDVEDDHGQIVYCSELHARLDSYVPGLDV